MPGDQSSTAEGNFVKPESGQRRQDQSLGDRQGGISALKFCGGDFVTGQKGAFSYR